MLALLRRQPGQSRPDLGRAMDIAGFSASRLADGLVERGLLAEGAPVVKGRGQPSPSLFLRPQAAHSIGISLMTDAAQLLLVDFVGAPLASRILRLDQTDVSGVSARLRAAMDEMLAEARLDRSTLAGAGMGITGYFIGEDGWVNPPAPLDDWALTDFRPQVAASLGCGLWLDNDGNAAALGEAAFGAGRKYDSFAYLFFSAGFGGGLVLNGELMRGHHGNAGEFGGALPRGYPVPNLERLRVFMQEKTVQPLGLTDAVAFAKPGAPGVAEWLDEAMQSLEVVISAIAGAVDPQAIVLGGRLPPALAEELIRSLRFHNPERRGHARPMPVLIASELSVDATALGAAALPLNAAFF